MRTVQTAISNLGLVQSNVIKLKLLDLIGREFSFVEDGKLIKYNQDITIDSDILELELWENENSKSKTFYQLTINNINYNFTVPKGDGVHDLMALFQLGNNDEVSYILRDVLYFEEDFIEKIKLFFNKKEPNFTENQQRAFNQFVYYADEVYGSNRKFDFIEKLDQYLGSL